MAMKNKPLKTARNFRLDTEINEQLVQKSELLGITQTRMIEDALRLYFGGGLTKLMSSRMSALKGSKAA
jgi:hypothetical protein